VIALCIGTVMYSSRLIPRIIPTIGLIGAPLLIAAATATVFAHLDQISSTGALATLPIAFWEEPQTPGSSGAVVLGRDNPNPTGVGSEGDRIDDPHAGSLGAPCVRATRC
jgi:hypothetical protein